MNLEILKKELSNGKYAILCGAGISKNSGLPDAGELCDDILSKLGMNATDKGPFVDKKLPFESFMETLYRNTDISEILEIFAHGEPSLAHQFLARFAKKGFLNTIFTTNFDILIENAIQNEGLKRDKDFFVYYDEGFFNRINYKENILKRVFAKSNKITVVKIHGSVDDKNTIRTTLNAVAQKHLNEKRLYPLKYCFSDGPHEKILILGYSCSDIFDINPVIESLKSKNKEVILIDYKKNVPVEENRENPLPYPFSNFKGRMIQVNTDQLIQFLSDEIQCPKYPQFWKKYTEKWDKKVSMELGLKNYICGLLFSKVSQFQKSAEYIEKALDEANKAEVFKRKAQYTLGLSNADFLLGDCKKGVVLANASMEMYSALKDSENVILCLNTLGNCCITQGLLAQARDYYEQSLSLSSKDDSSVLSSLGCVMIKMGELKKAEEYFIRAIARDIESGNKDGEARCCIHLGIIYTGLNVTDKAEQYLRNAEKIGQQIANDNLVAKSRIDLAILYNNLRKNEDAKKLLIDAISLCKRAGDLEGEARACLWIGYA